MAAMSIILFQACGSEIEEQVVGPWKLSNSTIKNLDSISEARSRELTKGLESALELLNSEIDSTFAEPKRSELIARRNDLNSSINNYSKENIKNLFLEQQKLLKDSLLFFFGKDKRITIRLGSNDVDNVSAGTWKMNGDTIFTFFDNYPSETLIVRDVNSGKLVLESKAVGSFGEWLILELDRM